MSPTHSVLSVPQIASHGAVPPLSLHTCVHSCLTVRHQPRVGGFQHPPRPRTSQAVPTRDGPCTWSCCWEHGDALEGPEARDRGKARAGGGSPGQAGALRDAGWPGRCFPHESSFAPWNFHRPSHEHPGTAAEMAPSWQRCRMAQGQAATATGS